MSDGSLPRIALALVAALALVGCDRGDAAASAETRTPATAATPPAKAAPPAVLIAGDGLRLVDAGGARAIPFGTARAAGVKAVSLGLGGPPDTTSGPQDCGPGPLSSAMWNKGLQLFFQNDRFVGWSGAVDLKTAEGIGFGSTRAAVEKAYHPTIEQTSLGTEFTAGGLSGVFESNAKDAAVSEVWAGMTCVAR